MSSQKMHGQIDARMAGLERVSQLNYCIGNAVMHWSDSTEQSGQNLTRDNVIEDTSASRPIRQSVAGIPRRSRPIPPNANHPRQLHAVAIFTAMATQISARSDVTAQAL